MRKIILQTLKRPFRYYPRIPNSVNWTKFIKQSSNYFRIPLKRTEYLFQTYYQFSKNKGYPEKLGERKTLSFEEAFLIYLVTIRLCPTNIVEIGTQYGKSTRRILDIVELENLNATVTCFDLIDEIKFIDHQEVNLVLQDLTYKFHERVLLELTPEVIYLDAHPYELLKNLITQFYEWSKSEQSILAIHDCSPGLYNPRMKISKVDSQAVTSYTGFWERHVLSEVFSVPNNKIDDISTPTHRLKIFNTPHGLALLAPKSILSPRSPEMLK